VLTTRLSSIDPGQKVRIEGSDGAEGSAVPQAQSAAPAKNT
jgi:hypothetical protein